MSEYHKIENMSEIEVAYFAGLLDGEGCVRVGAFKNSNGIINYRAYMVIAMTDEAPITWLVENMGGGKYVDKKLRHGNSKICFSWTLNARLGAALLERALPYLLVKKKQAENFIAFTKTIRPQNTTRRNNPITNEEIAAREFFAKRSRELNKKGK